MNVTYTIQFKGFHEKAAAALEKMLRDDIAAYPKRLRMESASVELSAKAEPKSEVKPAPAKKTVAERIVEKARNPKAKKVKDAKS